MQLAVISLSLLSFITARIVALCDVFADDVYGAIISYEAEIFVTMFLPISLKLKQHFSAFKEFEVTYHDENNLSRAASITSARRSNARKKNQSVVETMMLDKVEQTMETNTNDPLLTDMTTPDELVTVGGNMSTPNGDVLMTDSGLPPAKRLLNKTSNTHNMDFTTPDSIDFENSVVTPTPDKPGTVPGKHYMGSGINHPSLVETKKKKVKTPKVNRYTDQNVPTYNALFEYKESSKAMSKLSPSQGQSNSSQSMSRQLHTTGQNISQSQSRYGTKQNKLKRSAKVNSSVNLNKSSFISDTDFGVKARPMNTIKEDDSISEDANEGHESMMSDDLLQGLGAGQGRW